MKTAFQIISIAVASSVAFSQSFNINFSNDGHVPSASYAAEGLAGWWNGYSEDSGTALALNGLAGQSTGVSLTVTNINEYQHINHTSGDFDLGILVNDRVLSHSAPVTLDFAGLANGNYEVWTYVIGAGGEQITINGDFTTTETISGIWPGELILGQTHSLHMVEVTDGTLSITAAGGDPFINGVQLVIPAPSSLAILGVATMFTTRRRRN